MPNKGSRRISDQRREEILACAPEHILNRRSSALQDIAHHIGLTYSGLRACMPSVDELIRQLCLRHLNEAFDAVRLPADWDGTPIEVLHAMSSALLDYLNENAPRHLVFLLHRPSLDTSSRNAADTLLVYLNNNFQLALQAISPQKPFVTLQSPASMLLGQIMHLNLWWPREPHFAKDIWLHQQLGQLAGTSLLARKSPGVLPPIPEGGNPAERRPSRPALLEGKKEGR